MQHHHQHLFVCTCGCAEHQFIVSYFTDLPENSDTYVALHLAPQGFWKRVVTACKYLCGYQSMYGAFDEIILSTEQCLELSQILQRRAQRGTPDQTRYE
jgi:hypothetical protein